MGSYLLAFVAAFAFVFLKAFQQLSVVHKNYAWILPTSMCMATCEVYVIATTAKNGWGLLVLFIGFGSGLGAMASMYIHGRFIKK